MSGEEFVPQYVQDCIKQGIQFPADIRKHAEQEIQQINERIQENEALRNRQNNLRAVIRHMGGGTKAKKPTKTMDFAISWGDLEDSFKDLCIAICGYVSSNPMGASPREIMNVVSDPREHKAVYSAIKWLHHHNVVSRRDSDRAIVKGEGWDSFANQK